MVRKDYDIDSKIRELGDKVLASARDPATFIGLHPITQKVVSIGFERCRRFADGLQRLRQADERYYLIGNVTSICLEHCIYMGLKDCPGFEQRVKYYYAQIISSSDSEDICKVGEVIEDKVEWNSDNQEFLQVSFYGDER